MTSSDRCLSGAETDAPMEARATERMQCAKCAVTRWRRACVPGGALLPEAGCPLNTSSRRLGARSDTWKEKSGQTKFWKPEAIDEIIKLDETIRKGAYIERDQEHESAGSSYIYADKKSKGTVKKVRGTMAQNQERGVRRRGQQPQMSTGKWGAERWAVGQLGKSPIIFQRAQWRIVAKFQGGGNRRSKKWKIKIIFSRCR